MKVKEAMSPHLCCFCFQMVQKTLETCSKNVVLQGNQYTYM